MYSYMGSLCDRKPGRARVELRDDAELEHSPSGAEQGRPLLPGLWYL